MGRLIEILSQFFHYKIHCVLEICILNPINKAFGFNFTFLEK